MAMKEVGATGLGCCRGRALSPEGSRFLRLLSIRLGIKGKGKEAGMDLRCPAWVGRICAVGFTGFDSDFRWDMLGNSMRFLDWLDQRVTVEETALYQSPTGEPG